MTKIIQRHDTAANWSTINPVLALGEMGVETDTNKFKFGDGITSYNELPYAAGEGGGTGGSGTIITSRDGTTSYNKLALGDGLIVDTGDIAWTNPAMTANSMDGYVITASSNFVDGLGSDMYKAFDKDLDTNDSCWYTGNVSMPQWIMLECPTPVRVTSCMIKNEVYTPVNFKSGYIQGSNDGSSFDTLYTISNRADTTGLAETYTFENSKYYKYLRVYCTESYGSGLSIQEIEFSGYVKSEGAVPTLNAKVDAYTKEETDNLLLDKQDKLTAGDGVSIQLEGEEYELTSTFPKSLNNNSVKLLENINIDYGVYMTLRCVNDNPPNFDIQLVNRTDGANSTCGYIIYTSNGYIAAATINNSTSTNVYETNILASDVSNIYIKMSIKPITGYGTLEISTDNINFITVQEDTQPNLLNAQCWFKTGSILTVNSVYAYKFPVYNYIKAKPDNTTIGFNSSGQLACKPNMLSDSNFIEFCTANADAIKAALGLS